MPHNRLVAFVLVFAAALGALPAVADDWVVKRLRGGVFTFIDGGWVQLGRGEIVPARRVLQTLPNGRVTLQRGAEIVEVGPDTRVEIIDRDGQSFTTVKQWFGSVEVTAEVQDVEHFAVRTPFVAAVVKGTRFVVVADEDGAEVTVKRGQVAVEDTATHSTATVIAGQSASTGSDGGLFVDGRGELPVVMDSRGVPIPQVATGDSPRDQGSDNGGGNAYGRDNNPGNGGNNSNNGGNSNDNSGNGGGNGNSGNGNSGNGNNGNGNNGNSEPGGNHGQGGGNNGNGGGN